ncbi:MAG: ABC transporter ATP-binding protein [Planctomycetes bacterium]|nr:ABC transporter ATP-binding protein [Planctomycetota bacterium]
MLIKLDKISKIYHVGEVDIPAVRDISLDINAGELMAIMGASGSGKTTLMNIIGCLDRPSKGRYLLDGQDITTMSKNELAYVRNKKIGFVFQSFNLLSRTSALENVELPMFYGNNLTSRQKRARAVEVLERVGLGQRMKHHPSQLSGGEQQRVAIARSLVNQPKILLADEPTGNLDSKRGKEIMELFQQLNKEGITIVLITHDKDTAFYARRVVHVKDGLIVNN